MSWVGIANSGELFYSTGGNDLVAYGELSGDVTGTIGVTEVGALRGLPLAPVLAPNSGDILQYDGAQWTTGSSVGSGVDIDFHTLLNGARHTDTELHVPTQGDIVVAGTGSTWEGLSLGSTEFVLYSDGTDVVYTRLGQNTPFENGLIGAPGVTFNGDRFSGMYLASSGIVGLVVGTDELLTLDGGSTQVTIDAGQVVKTTVGTTTTLTNADYIYLCTAAPATVTLPPSPLSGQVHTVKDRDGNAGFGPNSITIAGNGSNIDGNSSIRIRRSYGSFTLIYNGTEWNII